MTVIGTAEGLALPKSGKMKFITKPCEECGGRGYHLTGEAFICRRCVGTGATFSLRRCLAFVLNLGLVGTLLLSLVNFLILQV
jgi:hypothetical protein